MKINLTAMLREDAVHLLADPDVRNAVEEAKNLLEGLDAFL